MTVQAERDRVLTKAKEALEHLLEQHPPCMATVPFEDLIERYEFLTSADPDTVVSEDK